jgi:hypothetical protein
MEMQQLLSTSTFDCEQNETAFDSCVLSEGLNTMPCLLPFQHASLVNESTLKICQDSDESMVAFQKFQQASWACKPPCTQLTTEFENSKPQYLRSLYLPNVHQNIPKSAYYLNLPNTVKVSTGVLNYGLISYVAAIAGWFNLFLGGSILMLWDRIWILICLILTKLEKFTGKLQVLTLIQQKILIVLICGILLYILIDCIVTVLNSPIETSTVLASNLSGFGISICLPQYIYQVDRLSSQPHKDVAITSEFWKIGSSYQPYKDVANTSEFWKKGSNITSKILQLRVKKAGGGWALIWNNNTNSSSGQPNDSMFKTINVVSDMSVNFCQFLDLSSLPFPIDQVWINAVNDVSLVFHLAGQLLKSQNYYEIANMESVKMESSTLFLYVSEVRLQIEETSFQYIDAHHCQNYNSSWGYDDCLLDSALSNFGNQQEHRHSKIFLTTVGTKSISHAKSICTPFLHHRSLIIQGNVFLV